MTSIDAKEQPLQFRLLRLRPPSLHIRSEPRYDLDTDFVGDRDMDDDGGGGSEESCESCGNKEEGFSMQRCFTDRLQLRELPEQLGVTGTLQLPQDFGRVYIGQQLVLAIVLQNTSSRIPVHRMNVRVEMLNDKKRAILYDSTGDEELPTIAAGEHHEILVRQDIKDIGNTTLIVKAWFLLPGGSDNVYQGGSFVFDVANPLTVRTKTRSIGLEHCVYLEAILENQTEDVMVLENVELIPYQECDVKRFDPPLPRRIGGVQGPITDLCNRKWWLPPKGGSCSFVFQVYPNMPNIDDETGIQKNENKTPRNLQNVPDQESVGKLDIQWRGPMGAYARLQTQLIPGKRLSDHQGNLVSMSLSGIKPRRIQNTWEPFVVQINVTNNSADKIGPVRLTLFDGPRKYNNIRNTEGIDMRKESIASAHLEQDDESLGIVLDGKQGIDLEPIPSGSAVDVEMRFIALSEGRHFIRGIVLVDPDNGKVYDQLPPIEIFAL